MYEIPGLVVAFIAGIFAGFVFFGGLWLTVKRVVVDQQPALLMLASMIVRVVLVMSIFYLTSDGDLMRVFASLAGFIVVRFIMIRLLEPRPERLGGQYGTES